MSMYVFLYCFHACFLYMLYTIMSLYSTLGDYMGRKLKSAKIPKKTIKKIKCIDCGKKTDNYYTSSINSGKINRCSDCYEKFIIRSIRYDMRSIESEEK